MKGAPTTCPITKAARLLSDTWTMLILHDILGGPKRFCELERSLEGISTRTLSLKLKKLEADKLIKKDAAGTYCATKKGEGVKVIENAMRRFGEQYL